MNWLLKDQVKGQAGNQGTQRPADLPEHIERRLRFALARFGNRVERVIVFLQDRNGPKGGIDKVCRILAKVQGCGSMMAAVADSPKTAAELLPVLFKRKLDLHQTTFAMGEAIAHLNHLWLGGRLQRQAGADGVWRFGP